MHQLKILCAEHRELESLAASLLAAASRDPLDVPRLIAARRALAQAVAAHLTREAIIVLAALRASNEAEHHALARRYTEDLLSMRQASAAHHARWNTAAIRMNPLDYRISAQTLVRGLAARIVWEESEVFPAVGSLAGLAPLDWAC